MVSRTATIVDVLTRQMDDAFSGPDWHSVLKNLESCTEEDWDWVAPGGKRTIRAMVQHLGQDKAMMDAEVYRHSELTWDDPASRGVPESDGSPEAVIAWLTRVHDQLRESISALTDAELDEIRPGFWDNPRTLQASIEILIQHDIYHAGEINHIRALHQGND